MSRIQQTFEQLKAQQKKALIPFLTAGDPTPGHTVELLHQLVSSGADIIELGVPFSDPMADGPTIQRASERALKHQVGLSDVLEMVSQFRQQNQQTPIVLMGYANPIEAMGWSSFAQQCQQAGVDGVLTVDFPPEESEQEFACLRQHQIDPIFLLAPTSSEARIRLVAEQARGYVYYVSLKGVTGAANLDLSAVEQKLAVLKRYLDLPVGVGFGIRDTETAAAVARLADGVVIGSRIVQEIEQAPEDQAVARVGALVATLRQAV